MTEAELAAVTQQRVAAIIAEQRRLDAEFLAQV